MHAPTPLTRSSLAAGQKPLRGPDGRLLPGQTANPGGRPKGLAQRVRDLVDFEAIVKALEDIALGRMPPGITATQHSTPTVAERISAAKLLIERGHGKAEQTINLAASVATGGDAQLFDVTRLDAAALGILEAAISQRLLDQPELLDDEPPSDGVINVDAVEVVK